MNRTLLTSAMLGLATLLPAAAQRPGAQREAAPDFKVGKLAGTDLSSLRHQQRRAPQNQTADEMSGPICMAPAREGAGSDFYFYGPLGYADSWDGVTDGLYRLTAQGDPTVEFGFMDHGWTYETIDPQWGWIENGQMHIANIVEAMSRIYVYEMYTLDMQTWEIVDKEDILPSLYEGWMQPFMQVAAYNPSDGYLYGYGSNESGAGFAFTRAKADDVADAEVLVELDWQRYSERCMSLCYDPEGNVLYGVNQSGNLVRVDLQGNQTLLAKNPLAYRLYKATSGIIMDSDSNCLYMNLSNSNDYSSYLYRYDLATEEFELCCQFDNDMTFTCFMSSLSLDNPALVAMPKLVADTFGGAELDGTLTYLIPSAMADGSVFEGNAALTVLVDETEVFSGTCAAGAEVPVSLTVSQGMHTVKAFVTAGGKTSRPCFVTRWFGHDVPFAPELKSYKDGKLKWYPVTKGIHAGYIDSAAVRYHVYCNGQEVEGSPVEATEIEVMLPEDKPYNGYILSVEAEANGMVSELTENEPVCVGVPWTPDVFFAPTMSEAYAFTHLPIGEYYPDWYVDVKDNGEIWFNSNFDNWEPMGNFIILPPMQLDDTSNYYTFSALTAIANEWGENDALEVWIGAEPTFEALTTQILGTTKPGIMWNEGGREVSNLFTVETPGVYYIGIKCVSPVNQAGVMVRNIAVTKTAQSLSGPAPLENMSGVAAEKGVLTADVTFTFPTKTADGGDYAEGTVLKAVISCVNSVSATGAPGETKTVTVKTEQGDNSIEGVCVLEDLESPVVSFNIYTGVDIPLAITDLTAEVTEDGLGVSLRWTPPTEGENGGYINPDELFYRINCMENYEYVYEAVNNYTYYCPQTNQAFRWMHVDACSAAGRPSNFYGVRVLTGSPYELPVTETFEGNELHYAPVMSATGAWYLNNPTKVVTNSDSEDNACLILLSDNGEGNAWLPMFSTVDCEGVEFTASIFNHPSITPACTLLAQTYGMEEPEVIGTFSREGQGWTDCSLTLPEKFLNRQWVRFFLKVSIQSNQAWMMDSYTVSPTSKVGELHNAAFNASAVNGGIQVSGAQGNVSVYSVDGRMVASGVSANGYLRFNLTKGVYIVSANGKSVKLNVR